MPPADWMFAHGDLKLPSVTCQGRSLRNGRTVLPRGERQRRGDRQDWIQQCHSSSQFWYLQGLPAGSANVSGTAASRCMHHPGGDWPSALVRDLRTVQPVLARLRKQKGRVLQPDACTSASWPEMQIVGCAGTELLTLVVSFCAFVQSASSS